MGSIAFGGAHVQESTTGMWLRTSYMLYRILIVMDKWIGLSLRCGDPPSPPGLLSIRDCNQKFAFTTWRFPSGVSRAWYQGSAVCFGPLWSPTFSIFSMASSMLPSVFRYIAVSSILFGKGGFSQDQLWPGQDLAVARVKHCCILLAVAGHTCRGFCQLHKCHVMDHIVLS